MLVLMFLLLPVMTGQAGTPEILSNGIVMPNEWPPDYGAQTRDPMPVPYLENPPAVIPIDGGRQLFVDDFLIERTTLQRGFHTPEYHELNPVIKPDKPWENQRRGWFAAPFSGGAWYDPADGLFKMWYTCGWLASMCYATSKDGVYWEKPKLDVREGTNVVLDPMHGDHRYFDTNTVWLDHEARDPDERFKYFATEVAGESKQFKGKTDWRLVYRTSPDGIHWSEPVAKREVAGDRTTAFYNPFRKVWVLSQRIGGYPVGRSRSYLEAPTAVALTEAATPNFSRKVDGMWLPFVEGDSVLWTNADDLDPRHTDPVFMEIEPQLYNLDAAPYESLMIGYFSIWQGPENDICRELNIHKRNYVMLGFSRDGFHWSRPYRGRFISSTWDESNWRYGNVQSVAGGPLVVGDELYIYFSGRAKPQGDAWDADTATGLAILRRDGFASMDASNNTETLTTRPVTFNGKHLFVNVDCPEGGLKVEVLNANGTTIDRARLTGRVLSEDAEAIEPFTLANSEPIADDRTLVRVKWRGGKDLADLAGKPVRFRFHLRNGSLYSFWVSPDKSGASHGYVGAGGPEFTGPTDTVGAAAFKR